MKMKKLLQGAFLATLKANSVETLAFSHKMQQRSNDRIKMIAMRERERKRNKKSLLYFLEKALGCTVAIFKIASEWSS